jgi:flagellar motor protein MotB
MSGISAGQEDEELTTWPAFVDLLAASALLFATLLAVLIFLWQRDVDVSRTERRSLYLALQRRNGDASGRRLYTVEDDGQFVRIYLEEATTFPPSRWQWESLRPEGKEALRNIATLLEADSLHTLYRQVRVLGHTDQVPYTTGSSVTNWELSASRAAVVARFLVAEAGLDPCRTSAAGMGPYYPRGWDGETPLNPSDTLAMRQNRRIELEVVPARARGAVEGPPCFKIGDKLPDARHGYGRVSAP